MSRYKPSTMPLAHTNMTLRPSKPPPELVCAVVCSDHGCQHTHVYLYLGGTYWKNYNNIVFTLDHNSQIESNFETLKSFVDKDVLNHIGRNKSCSRSTEIRRAACRCLHAHATYHQKRLCSIAFAKDDRENCQTDGSQVEPGDTRCRSRSQFRQRWRKKSRGIICMDLPAWSRRFTGFCDEDA